MRRWRAALALPVAALLLVLAPVGAGAYKTPVESVDNGVIMDVSPSKILYRDPDFTPGGTLHIKDRATGAVEDVPPVPNRYPVRAFLSPHGAIFAGGSEQPNIGVSEWRDGTMIDHGPTSSPTTLRVAGDYAVWSELGGSGSFVSRRDLAAGTTVEIDPGFTNFDPEPAANGDVYYVATPVGANYDIFRWRDGIIEQLTDDAYWNYAPLTDGVNVAYTKAVPNPAGFGDKTAALMTPAGEEILFDEFRDNDAPSPRYDLAGGWAVFSRIGSVGEAQVWRRSPAGVMSQVSPSGSSWFLNGLGPSGDVWIGSPAHFLARLGAPLFDMGDENLGDTRFTRGGGDWTFMEGGRWFVTHGGTIFELTTGYPRPKGATPLRFSLITAYEPCQSATRMHGPPLAFPSCSPPQKSSQYLTVGTGDSNGQPAKSNGHVLMTTVTGNPSTPADEADIKLDIEITDVRRSDNLQDYTGELQVNGALRLTDRDTVAVAGGRTHGTMGEVGFPFTIPCFATADTTVGATCSLITTWDVGGQFVKEGRRSIWQIGALEVFDGGADGDADTEGNTLFARPGVFIP